MAATWATIPCCYSHWRILFPFSRTFSLIQSPVKSVQPVAILTSRLYRSTPKKTIADADNPNTPLGMADRVPKEKDAVDAAGSACKPPYPPFADGRNPQTGEVNGPSGPEPTRFGDWERKGRVTDFLLRIRIASLTGSPDANRLCLQL